jgi:CDP-glucose 4,6-dehydratase
MSFWRNRRVFITGHTGFKGAWLALWLRHLGAKVGSFSLPPPDGGAYEDFAPLISSGEQFIDIRERDAVVKAIADAEPEVIFHLAAQALVLHGYKQPVLTYETNVLGTLNLLDAVRLCPSVRGVLVVTSDKVYANKGDGTPKTETSPLGGSDPYSNSKSCVESLVEAWRNSYLEPDGIGIVTARSGNVIGGGDVAADRLLPDFFRAVKGKRPLRVRHPEAVRPWQFILEPLAGYLDYAQELIAGTDRPPPALNFGPSALEAWPVHRLLDRLISHLGEGRWEKGEPPADKETKRLVLDAELAWQALKWRARLSVDDSLDLTAEWWREQQRGAAMIEVALNQIDQYQALTS